MLILKVFISGWSGVEFVVWVKNCRFKMLKFLE